MVFSLLFEPIYKALWSEAEWNGASDILWWYGQREITLHWSRTTSNVCSLQLVLWLFGTVWIKDDLNSKVKVSHLCLYHHIRCIFWLICTILMRYMSLNIYNLYFQVHEKFIQLNRDLANRLKHFESAYHDAERENAVFREELKRKGINISDLLQSKPKYTLCNGTTSKSAPRIVSPEKLPEGIAKQDFVAFRHPKCLPPKKEREHVIDWLEERSGRRRCVLA